VVTTDSLHDLIHIGRLFSACHVNLALANDGVFNYLIDAVSERTHITYEIEGDTAMAVEFFSGTAATGGTEIAAHNHNFGSSRVATTKVYHTPTITNVGTSRGVHRSGSAAAQARVGGQRRSIYEQVIPAGMKCLIRLTSKSGAAALNSDIEIIFYEA
jgi:hypothetical protein